MKPSPNVTCDILINHKYDRKKVEATATGGSVAEVQCSNTAMPHLLRSTYSEKEEIIYFTVGYLLAADQAEHNFSKCKVACEQTVAYSISTSHGHRVTITSTHLAEAFM